MKLFLFFFFPIVTTAQKNCVGFVVDRVTGQAIPYATVGLIKENKGATANQHGAFEITAFILKGDSLRVSSIGYESQKVPVSEWENGNAVKLNPKAALLNEVLILVNRKKQVYTLNDFNRCSWNWYYITNRTIHQLAQRFDAPKERMQLFSIELCKDASQSIFRLRIYDIDSITEGPSQDLLDTVIEVRSKEGNVQIDLEKHYTIIPGKSFFVAIEWLLIPFNEEIQKVKINGAKAVHTLYKPGIRWVSDNNSKKGSVWRLNYNGKWSHMYEPSQYKNFQITAKLR